MPQRHRSPSAPRPAAALAASPCRPSRPCSPPHRLPAAVEHRRPDPPPRPAARARRELPAGLLCLPRSNPRVRSPRIRLLFSPSLLLANQKPTMIAF
ncbi:hypothetical protein ZWY2020_002287 [Hordeum vulgare]|nr:hypothetical protein ZWY2020_048160 [Hordeum vulgare]KAI4971373.1 hypothetical protein ZWY2020_002287 [Hordeum vulgare]